MAEMIEDGQTGWIASWATPHGLAGALRLALKTPPERLAAMGEMAAARMRPLCDIEQVLLCPKERVSFAAPPRTAQSARRASTLSGSPFWLRPTG